MRKTKIICTIGPSSLNEETLTKMCQAGMDVARLNFSHGDHAEQKQKIDLIKKVREKLHVPLAMMLDTKAPSTGLAPSKTAALPSRTAIPLPSPPSRWKVIRPKFP